MACEWDTGFAGEFVFPQPGNFRELFVLILKLADLYFFADLPELKEAQVRLSEFRKGLAAKEKAGKRKEGEGEQAG